MNGSAHKAPVIKHTYQTHTYHKVLSHMWSSVWGKIKQHLPHTHTHTRPHTITITLYNNNSSINPNIWHQLRWKLCVCVCVCTRSNRDTMKHLLFAQTQTKVLCLQGLSCCRCSGWRRNMNGFTVLCWQKTHRVRVTVYVDGGFIITCTDSQVYHCMLIHFYFCLYWALGLSCCDTGSTRGLTDAFRG